MTGNIKVNWKRLILAMVISIGAGVISWLLTGNSMEIYRDLNKPVLSPPGQLFPIVWTILFILMGLASAGAVSLYKGVIPLNIILGFYFVMLSGRLFGTEYCAMAGIVVSGLMMTEQKH